MARRNSTEQYSVLGVHFGHDAGAAILVNGQIVADVAEERFARVKHSSDLPFESVDYCLRTAGIPIQAIDEIAVAGITTGDAFQSLFGLSLPWQGGNDREGNLLASAAD